MKENVAIECGPEFVRMQELCSELNHINALINSTRDFDEIMARVVVESAKAMGSESARIALREDNRWIFRYLYNLPEELIGRSFSDVEVDFAEKMAASISLALQNARLYKELHTTTERLQEAKRLGDALNRIDSLIHSTLDTDRIMREVLVEATEAIRAESAMLFEREGDMWLTKYVYKLSEELIGRRFTSEEVKHTAITTLTKAPLAVTDTFGNAQVHAPFIELLGIRSLLDFPLIVRGNVIGDLTFHYHSKPTAFTEAQIDFVGKLQTWVALALESARLFEEYKTTTKKLGEIQEHVGFFANALENSSQPFASGYPDGRLMTFNQAFVELTGYSADELRAMTWAVDLTPPEWREHEAKVLEELNRTGQPRLYEKEHMRKDDTRVPVELKVHQIADEKENALYYYAFITDITDRKRAEREVRQINRDLSNYVHELEYRNREIEQLSELVSLLQACVTAEETRRVIAKSVQGIFQTESGGVFLLNEERNILEPIALWGEMDTEEVFTSRECWALRLGRIYTVEAPGTETLCPHVRDTLRTAYICIPMVALNVTIGLLYLQFNAQWLSQPEELRRQTVENKRRIAEAVAESLALSLANFRLREELYIQSIHDPLTGLFNRRHMGEILEKEIRRASRKKQSLGILMIDIDHFKKFNDAYGHEAGDALLRELGDFFLANIRGEDYAFRYGGEEFMILLPEAPLEDARERAEQLREGVRSLTMQHRGRVLGHTTVSIGVAAFPEDGTTFDELIHAADTALYKAKEEGRDRVAMA